jgi:hypothetical protein
MIALFQLLFYGHVHEWKIIRWGNIANEKGKKIGTYYHLRCKKCGEVVERNLTVSAVR